MLWSLLVMGGGVSLCPAVSAQANHSLSLNGTTAYFNVPNSPSLSVTSALTVEAWVKTTPNGSAQSIVERYGQPDGGYGLRLGADGRVTFFTCQTNLDCNMATGGTAVTPGAWRHVAGVFDGAQLRVYVNGVLDGSAPGRAPNVGITGTLRVGARSDDLALKFSGLIDEARVAAVAVYGGNFTPQAQLAAVAGTRGLWKFDGQSGQDSSGNNNHGTPVGGAAFSTDVPGGGPVVPPPQDPRAIGGEWSTVQAWPYKAIHTHMLPTGKVMYYSSYENADDPQLWDPATGTIVDAAKAGYNIFCTGHSFLPDGKLLVTGGHILDFVGLPNTYIYDPFANTWTRRPDMNAGRWYPTNTTLPNGDVLVVSGQKDALAGMNPMPQVWQTASGTWRNLSNALLVMPFYPYMFVAPNGKVFNAGPEQTTRYLDTSGAGAWTAVASSNFGTRNWGSAVMYDRGRVLLVGGARTAFYGPASAGELPTATAEVIDLNAPTPSWRNVTPMSRPRKHHNATLLPDGKVLVTGGSSGAEGTNEMSVDPTYPAEVWDPVTERWTTWASLSVYRGYHATALLLPDGRILSASGDFGGPSYEIFSPPYLFKGARPTITSVPSSVGYGQALFVQTPDAISITKATWIRIASVTHGFNMGQVINHLSITQVTGGINVATPSSANDCPPGHYMLFILNGNGVPSVAKIVRIGPSAPTIPSVPGILTATATSSSQINLTWTDTSTNESGFKVERCTGSTCTNFSQIATVGAGVTTYSNTGLAAGTGYNYRVRAYNGGGDSPYSNTAGAWTFGSGTGLKGEYYNNRDLTSLRRTRTDATVNFDWGSGSPDSSISADTFSARWTGQVQPRYSETYTFYTTSDDGVRLWVNGQRIIDNWTDHGPTENSGTITLAAGQRYDIKMEYYENVGGATATLSWSSPRQAKQIIPQTQLYPAAGSASAPTPAGLSETAHAGDAGPFVWPPACRACGFTAAAPENLLTRVWQVPGLIAETRRGIHGVRAATFRR